MLISGVNLKIADNSMDSLTGKVRILPLTCYVADPLLSCLEIKTSAYFSVQMSPGNYNSG
jgi:hypothetical protein